jgi:hypothetical protein
VPDIVFDGGPYHGRRNSMAGLPARVTVAYMRPLPVLTWEPRPRWWRHPWRWLRWKPAPLPPIPEPEMLAYSDTGETRDGARIYAIGDGWPWFKGPEVGDDGNLYKATCAAMAAVPFPIRRDPETRWVMNAEWDQRLRALSIEMRDPPGPREYMLGIRVKVTADGGKPHLENRAYPADYP